MARKGKELSSDVKQIIVDLMLQGRKASEIAEMFDINRSTVGRICEKFKSNESGGVPFLKFVQLLIVS